MSMAVKNLDYQVGIYTNNASTLFNQKIYSKKITDEKVRIVFTLYQSIYFITNPLSSVMDTV